MVLLIAVLTLVVSFFVALHKLKRYLPSIFFSIFCFFLALFLFDYHMTLKWKKAMPETIYLLIDRSLSMPDLKLSANESETLKVFYFADTISKKSSLLNPQYTALFDSINLIKSRFGDSAKTIVISDFNDNYSFLPFKSYDFIYPVIPQSDYSNPVFSLLDVKYPDIVQSGEVEQAEVKIYSKKNEDIFVKVYQNNSLILEKKENIKRGLQSLTIPLFIEKEGFHSLRFDISSRNEVQSFSRIIQAVPQFYRIMFICGRPSPEYVFLKRFIEKIKWIRADYFLLKSSEEKIKDVDLTKYSGLILMDIKDSHFQSLSTIEKAIIKKIPIFYETGLRKYHEIKNILGLFTNHIYNEEFKEKKFIFNNQELLVKTSLASKEIIQEISENIKIFFGFETWRWGFSRELGDFSVNLFEEFWQNQINFLIKSKSKNIILEKLNYVIGEQNPLNTNATGIFFLQTNGQKIPFLVYTNLSEINLKEVNIEAAKKYNSNITFLNQIKEISTFINEIRGQKKVVQTEILEINFRKNIISILIMIISIVLFFFSRDYLEIKG